MARELNDNEIDLMAASSEIGTILTWNSELFTPLAEAIEATGKKVNELTVGEMRDLITDQFNEHQSIYRMEPQHGH